MKLSEEEVRIINKKIENPSLSVKCPKCGTELIFIEGRSSDEIRCGTPGCIKGVIRGI